MSPFITIFFCGPAIKSRPIRTKSFCLSFSLLRCGGKSRELYMATDSGVTVISKCCSCQICITTSFLRRSFDFPTEVVCRLAADCSSAVARRSCVRVWRTEDQCSSSLGTTRVWATASSFQTKCFMRCTAVLFDVFVSTILIGEAPKKCFARHASGYVRDSVLALFWICKYCQKNIYKFMLQWRMSVCILYKFKFHMQLYSPSTVLLLSSSPSPYFPSILVLDLGTRRFFPRLTPSLLSLSLPKWNA